MKRRAFIKLAGSASASALLVPSGLKARTQAGAKVYEVHDPKFVTGTKATPTAVNKQLVRDSVDKIAKAMGKNANLGKAWEALLPEITPASKIGIKVNCLMVRSSPQFCTLEAIINGLKSMFNGTFPAKNIFLFDNNLSMASFDPLHVDKAFGAANLDKLGIWHGKDTYNGETLRVGGDRTTFVSTKLSEAAKTPGKTIINFLCPRPHTLFAGKLSGHIKNMMGAVSTTRANYHAAAGRDASGQYYGFHNNKTDKYYVDLHKHMQPLTALYISDMILIPNRENGYWDKIGSRIAFTNDPCAADSYAVDKMLEAGLDKGKFVPTKKTPTALQAAGLGTTNYSIVKPGDPDPDPDPDPAVRHQAPSGATRELRITTIARNGQSMTLRVGRGTKPVEQIRIVNSEGRIVRNLRATRSGKTWGIFQWNGKDEKRRRVGSGTYFLEANRIPGALGRIALTR